MTTASPAETLLYFMPLDKKIKRSRVNAERQELNDQFLWNKLQKDRRTGALHRGQPECDQ